MQLTSRKNVLNTLTIPTMLLSFKAIHSMMSNEWEFHMGGPKELIIESRLSTIMKRADRQEKL